MTFDRKSLLLYICTDRTWLGNNNLAEQVEESIRNGATLVQLREKDITFKKFVEIANDIKAVCNRYNVPFIINDSVDVALAVNADGVHIGQSDEELRFARLRLRHDKIIGVSARNVEEAKKAAEDGADYIGVGAVFPTSTKKDAKLVSHKQLQEICNTVAIPVVAIGGISEDNIYELSGSGIEGVAVISAVFAKPNIGEATRNLRLLAEKVVGTK